MARTDVGNVDRTSSGVTAEADRDKAGLLTGAMAALTPARFRRVAPARSAPCRCVYCNHCKTTHRPLACQALDCRCLQFI